MTTRLPVLLENIRIAAPCQADWDEMAGDGRVRFCGRCEKNVYNLSAMTRSEAEALVAQKEGNLCVRLYQRQDGTVLTADCPVGARRQRLRQRMWASVCGAAASVALLVGLVTGRARADLTLETGKKGPHAQRLTVLGGAVAVAQTKLMGKPSMPPATPPAPPPTKRVGTMTMGEPSLAPTE